MISLNYFRYRIAIAIIVLGSYLHATAQQPVIKIDLNYTGRQEAETNEPGYTPWILKAGESDSITVNGVTIVFTRKGSIGTGLTTDWFKAGIQAPYYARVINDGITVLR